MRSAPWRARPRCPSIAWEEGKAVLSCADAIGAVLEKQVTGIDSKPSAEDYGSKNRSVVAASAKLSVHERDIPSAVEKTIQEVKQAKKKMRKLQEQLAVFEARELVQKAGGKILRHVWAEKSPEEGKLLALNIIRAGDFAVLFGIRAEEKDHLILASSGTLPLDMRELIPLVYSRIGGRGGGSPSLVEIVTEKGADLDAVLSSLGEHLEKKLQQ